MWVRISETAKNGEWGSWRITSVTDYNVSLYHVDPSDNTNRFTLDKAIYLVPIELRNIGIKCSFLDKVGKYHTYVYVGSDYVPDSWNEVNTYEDAKGKWYKGTEEDFYKNLSNIDMLHFSIQSFILILILLLTPAIILWLMQTLIQVIF